MVHKFLLGPEKTRTVLIFPASGSGGPAVAEILVDLWPYWSLVVYLCDLSSPQQVYKKLGQTHLALMNFSWAMDLDPKGANNQIKEAIDKRYLPEDEGTVCPTCLSLSVSPVSVSPLTCLCVPAVAEVDDSQDSSLMTDADDTQLHTPESDDVL